ncbi:MAG: hypothetical protein IKX86_02390 [Clostridia bacterium]|nr:hypothetical protein [Clostridia bacterium]
MKNKAAALILVLILAVSMIARVSAENTVKLSVDFSVMDATREGETLELDDVRAYAAENVKIAEFNAEGNILAAAENKKPSWIMYKLDAPEGETFSTLMLKSFASINDFLLEDVGSYAGNVFGLYVSGDGVFDYENDKPVKSGMLGKMNHKWDLSSAAKGLGTVYVSVYFINNSDFVDWVRFYSFDFEGKTVAPGEAGPAAEPVQLPSIDYSKTILSIDAGLQTAPLTADPATPEKPEMMKAFFSHNVVINDDGSRNCITPVNGMFTADYDLNPDKTYDGGKDSIRYGVRAEGSGINNPYVCYRLCADRGETIDSLKLNMRYYLRQGNNCYYQIGIWVTDTFEIDENGAYDFTAKSCTKLLSSTDQAEVKVLADAETIDLSESVRALNSREVFVILLLNRGFGAEDATRLRIRDLSIEATQTGGAVSEIGSSAGAGTEPAGTGNVTTEKPQGGGEKSVDPIAIILIVAGVLIAVIIVVAVISVLKKKK